MYPERVSLVGREHEQAQLRALLREHSPVTVVGVGGVGKTRLVSALVSDEPWPDGAPVVCELAGLRGPDEVADAVADALGLPSLEAAAVALTGTRRLLVLDNCEHVVDAVAGVVERLAVDCPGITVLATSREPLAVPGEHVLALGPLGLPAGRDRDAVEQSPAGRLFLELAAAAGSAPPTDDGWAAIADLCRCLDGLPLAIELAAARTRSLTAAEILAHIAQRPDVLSRRRDRGPARHRSLEAAIDWSYDRLPETTRLVFARLAVFTGRFSADAAQSVVAPPDGGWVDVPDELDQLVAQSLLTVEQRAGRSWFGLLDTLRGYARVRLTERGELDATTDRWIDALVTTANEVVRRGMRSGSFDAWVTVQTLQGDLLAGLRWCLDRDVGAQRAVRLFAPLWWTAYHARADAVAELGDRLLARWPDPDEPGWTEAAAITAFAHVVLGDLDGGEALGREVLAAPYSMPAGVIARRALVAHAHARGDDDGALTWAEKGIADAETGGLRAWRHELEALRAFLLGGVGRVDEAVAQALAAREGAADLGSPTLLGWTSLAHGCLVALRDAAAGRDLLRPLAERCAGVDDHLGTGRSLRALGAVCALDGDVPEAVGALRGALSAFTKIGHASQLRATLRWVAFLAGQAGHDDVSQALHRAAGTKPSPVSDVLERVHAARLAAADVDLNAPPLPLRDAVELARRELDALAGEEAEPTGASSGPVAGGPGGVASSNHFVSDGAVWTLAFGGTTVRVPDAKGLHDLAVLLARPGREVAATELVGAAVQQPDTGPALDAEARRQYERRVVDLQEELAELEDANDTGRAEKTRVELDFLLDELAAATGLGGRARVHGGTSERARGAVTWRIRSAIKRIHDLHPALGAHLRASVSTGAWCVYRPETALTWTT